MGKEGPAGGISAVALVIDAITCVGALAVAYLVLKDLLNII